MNCVKVRKKINEELTLDLISKGYLHEIKHMARLTAGSKSYTARCSVTLFARLSEWILTSDGPSLIRLVDKTNFEEAEVTWNEPHEPHRLSIRLNARSASIFDTAFFVFVSAMNACDSSAVSYAPRYSSPSSSSRKRDMPPRNDANDLQELFTRRVSNF